MSFIIRCQTNQGMHRLPFPSPSATFADLQSAIQKKYNIDPEAQVISRTRPNAPDFIDNVSPSATLQSIGLKHGTIIYLIMVENQVQQYKQQQEAAKSNEEQKDWKPPTSSTTSSGGSALKPMPRRKKKVMSKRLDDLKNDEDDVVDAGPKHIPFHEYIEERQRKLAKTQPWNIDPPKYNYKR